MTPQELREAIVEVNNISMLGDDVYAGKGTLTPYGEGIRNLLKCAESVLKVLEMPERKEGMYPANYDYKAEGYNLCLQEVKQTLTEYK